MYILGLATMTESAAVLMHDGRVVAAAEEERFSRVKHDGGFPYRAVDFALASQRLSLGDVDHVAVYWNPYKLGHRARYMTETLLTDAGLFAEKLRRAFTVWKGAGAEDSGWGSLFRTRQNLGRRFGDAPRRIHFLDHHACHMASCFYPSSFPDAAILVMDGAGEAACTTWGAGRGTHLDKLDEHCLPHSLGHYYAAITGYLGFKMLDGEYKLMGLSPYGDPSGARWIRQHFLRDAGGGRYGLDTRVLDYHRALRGRFDGEFAKHFGPPREHSETAEFNERHRDIAASAQRAFEEVVLAMAGELQRRTGARRLAVAGGCGLNCTANGKILLSGIFDEIYVPPVPHDAGGALGAAMLLYTQLTGRRPEPVAHAQFGPAYGTAEVEAALARRSDVGAERLDEDEIASRAAAALAKGAVLAWMQGPMEYGPRALGNRSFLADPRSDSIRDTINEKIKKRELFRPFAPSVKAEKASAYFRISQPSPFMTIIVPVREDKREVIPAVTHVDGTARPQTVERAVNPRYWKLLDRFEALTGVPVLLNTSFNIQEPIVCTPDDALATFAGSGVDALVLGDCWVTRRNGTGRRNGNGRG
jgi:carbamoyltransferase